MQFTNATLEAVVSDTWGDLIAGDGFPSGTRLIEPGELRDPRYPDVSRIGLVTYRRDSAAFTIVDLEIRPWATSNTHAIIAALARAMLLLRQKHHFHLIYERGGYC